MKDLLINTENERLTTNGINHFRNRFNNASNNFTNRFDSDLKIREEDLLEPSVFYKMATGQIPDLWDVCHALSAAFNSKNTTFSALQFIPVLQKMDSLDPNQVKKFLKNRETRQVLISNDYFEVVLIHWKPGKVSEIHGHPAGGCVFKVLQGKLQELRYSPDDSANLLASASYRAGSIAYLDDYMAYHQVGNPFGSSAVSLHAYVK